MMWPPVKDTVAGHLRSLQSRYLPLRREALQVLLRLGPLSPDAIADLSEVLHDADPRIGEGAATLLGRIGAAATPALGAALTNPNKYVRREAARALGKIGPDAHVAVESLANVLRDPDLKTRSAAALALGLIGPSAHPAVPALIAALPERHKFCHRLVTWALAQMGEAVLPAVQEALQATNDEVRQQAATFLDQLRQKDRARESTRLVPLIDQEVRRMYQPTPLVPCH